MAGKVYLSQNSNDLDEMTSELKQFFNCASNIIDRSVKVERERKNKLREGEEIERRERR